MLMWLMCRDCYGACVMVASEHSGRYNNFAIGCHVAARGMIQSWIFEAIQNSISAREISYRVVAAHQEILTIGQLIIATAAGLGRIWRGFVRLVCHTITSTSCTL